MQNEINDKDYYYIADSINGEEFVARIDFATKAEALVEMDKYENVYRHPENYRVALNHCWEDEKGHRHDERITTISFSRKENNL